MILNYAQAQQRALEWRPASDDGKKAPAGPPTVRDAIDRYLTALEHRGRSTNDVRIRAKLHILPSLGSELVEDLTTERLQRWLAETAKLPPRLRQKLGAAAPRFKLMAEDDQTKRRRRSTANRVLTILKAALNYSFDEGHVGSNNAWGRRLKPFRQVDAARTRFLSVAEAKRLTNACDPDCRNLVMAGLYTGARLGELSRLTVADFNPDARTLAIWQSKTVKARHVYLTGEGCAFFSNSLPAAPAARSCYARRMARPGEKRAVAADGRCGRAGEDRAADQLSRATPHLRQPGGHGRRALARWPGIWTRR